MKTLTFHGTDNPDGLLSLVNSLPSDFDDDRYEIEFPSSFLYSSSFPIIAAWAKRSPRETDIRLNLDHCQEAARRLVHNVGLTDIVELDLESPRNVIKGEANVPLQPVVVGRSTEQVLDRVYHMIDDWAAEERDTSPFKTVLSELAENILVHSEASTPGYVHAKLHRTAVAERCEIAFADSGIGIRSSYLEGTNDVVKERIKNGASPVQVAVDGLNSSKPRDISPGGRSHFGYGLFTVKRLIELNRGKMTVISGDEYITLDRYKQRIGRLNNPWPGTIVALVIDLANPLALAEVYAEEVTRLVREPQEQLETMAARRTGSLGEAPEEMASAPQSPAMKQQSGEEKRLVVRDFATKLLARETGLIIRAEIATLLVDGAVVEVDLDGVEDITPSVADECFGKLAIRLGESKFQSRIIFRGGSPLLHRLIEFVVANRLRAKQGD
jgi:STAS-like domain of unknown function (DUF4325)/Histidine kinase-, DNA gyrase B-, and HSP90-like ATPase